MGACALPVKDKKKLGAKVGNTLVKDYGKKKYYSVSEIKDAMKKNSYSIDYYCWGYSLYLPPDVFHEHHEKIGQVCDYESMRSEMVSAITDGSSGSWFDVDLSWFEWPDFDISSIFSSTDIDP
jgi:hypothetical protein